MCTSISRIFFPEILRFSQINRVLLGKEEKEKISGQLFLIHFRPNFPAYWCIYLVKSKAKAPERGEEGILLKEIRKLHRRSKYLDFLLLLSFSCLICLEKPFSRNLLPPWKRDNTGFFRIFLRFSGFPGISGSLDRRLCHQDTKAVGPPPA